MLRKLFSSIRNKNRHYLETIEVKRKVHEESGLIYYVWHYSSFHKKHKRLGTTRDYYTCKVWPHVSYEEAKSKSIAFRPEYQGEEALSLMSGYTKSHAQLDFGDYLAGGMNVWEFPDGSCIVQIVSYRTKEKSRLRVPPEVVQFHTRKHS